MARRGPDPPAGMVERARALLADGRNRAHPRRTAKRLAEEFGTSLRTAWRALGVIVREEMAAAVERFGGHVPTAVAKAPRAAARKRGKGS